MKVCFDTFGCRLNRAEALQLEADYEAAGWLVVNSHAEANRIIIRACSVTAHAQKECENHISRLKTKYPFKEIIVQGCLKKKDSLSTKISAQIENDIAVPTKTARAYLKIQDGCNSNCSFCIVPTFRGASKSVPFEDVLSRAKRFIDAGYHELVVTGCNLAQYNSSARRLAELLDALTNLSTETRVRLGSLEPSSIAKDTLDVMANKNNFCKFLHLTVQSGSDIILSSMRRHYRHKDIDELSQKALQLMPNIALCCDIITGFPGENELDFCATKRLIQSLPFSKVHVFPYSERPGTLAATLPNSVPVEIRRARAKEIAEIADKERTKFAKSFISRDVQILIENDLPFTGWSGEYLWCECHNLPHNKSFRKQLITARVRDTKNHSLICDFISN